MYPLSNALATVYTAAPGYAFVAWRRVSDDLVALSP